MVNRKLYLKIIGSVFLIVVCSVLGSALLTTGTSYFLSLICLIIVVLTALSQIRWMNAMNRKISVFFESIRNEDTSLRYLGTTDDPFLKSLCTEMNRIVELFSKNRNETEEKRLYYESILRVLTHEIGNSITPIRTLSADLLKYSSIYTPEQIQEGLDVIHSQAKNLSSFLDSYHRLTHLPEPERSEICVTQLFHKLERLLHAEPEGNKIHFKAPDDLILHADQNLLTLALINLIRNALQAIKGQTDGSISIEAFSASGHVQITITDNGPGILPEQIPVIFTPFFSTKPGGSGIGLSISHRITQLHGGTLTVESQPDIRTVFRMSF